MPYSLLSLLIGCFFVPIVLSAAETSPPKHDYKVMSYNVRNFLLTNRSRNGKEKKPKPESEKKALYTIVHEESPDILALIEMGDRSFLGEFLMAMDQRGNEYPYSEWIQGSDPDRHICLVSRFPIVERNSHTNDTFRIGEQTLGVARGFIEADLQLPGSERLKVFVAHLKSKLRNDDVEGGSDAIRLHEAKLLRQHVNEDLVKNPTLKLLMMGDFNDTPESIPLQHLLEHKIPLFDLLPINTKGYSGTYYYRPAKHFERIDYMIVSESLRKDYIESSARIRDDKLAWKASDHFPIQARFRIIRSGTTQKRP